MTVRQYRHRRVSVAALGIFLLGAACAGRASAQVAQSPRVTLNANVQLTKLHPDVKKARLLCSAPLANGQSRTGTSAEENILNRALNKTMQALVVLFAVDFENPANRTVNVTCRLQLSNGGAFSNAQPSAAEPMAILPSNWLLVATGSTVTWTQSITFPNTAP